MSSQADLSITPESKSPRSLKSRVFRAGGWIFVGLVAGTVIRLVSNLVMTRLLAPDVFGIMAIAWVIHIIISLLADIGLTQAVIQSPHGEDRKFLNTAWTLQVIQGWWIWGVCALAALGLHEARILEWLRADSVYASPILPIVFTAISFQAVIRGYQSMKVCTVNRQLDLRPVIQLELLSSIVSFLVTALLALATHSIWAFVIGNLAASAITTLASFLWLPGPNDHFQWDKGAIADLMRFGKWVVISSTISVVASNGDRLLLAGWLDPAALGNYSIALSLVSTIESAMSRLSSNVLMPAMSEVSRQSQERLPALYFRMRFISDAAFVGMAGFLFSASSGIVRLLFDPRYTSAGHMLQLLSFTLLFSRYDLTQNAYLSLGRPSYITAMNFARLGSLFIMLPGLFYFYGVQGAIIGIAFHRLPTLALIFWFNRRHGLNHIFIELTALCLWPLGWIAGTAFTSILRWY